MLHNRWIRIRSRPGTSNGKQPLPGQIFRNPDLAKTFRLLQAQGRDAFYKGEIAQAIVAKSTALGGTMTLRGSGRLQGRVGRAGAHQYHGYDVLELPPPSQAWAANEMLNILEACVPQWTTGQTLASLGPANPEYWHLMVEAKKLAYADLYRYNADPNFATVPLAKLLSEAYAALAVRQDRSAACFHARATGVISAMAGDTIVLSTADEEGNMVSWVNSNFSASAQA